MSAGTASESGFTLVECVVALAVLAGALAAGYVGLKGALDSRSASERQAEALELARALLAAEGVELTLQAGRREGSSADGLAWTVDVTAHDGDAAVPQRAGLPAYRVTVTVGKDGRTLLSLTTIRLGRIR